MTWACHYSTEQCSWCSTVVRWLWLIYSSVALPDNYWKWHTFQYLGLSFPGCYIVEHNDFIDYTVQIMSLYMFNSNVCKIPSYTAPILNHVNTCSFKELTLRSNGISFCISLHSISRKKKTGKFSFNWYQILNIFTFEKSLGAFFFYLHHHYYNNFTWK